MWLDALTPKQLLFFWSAARTLEERGHETLLTTRDYEELNKLSKRLRARTRPVGRYGGADLRSKLSASLRRAVELYREAESFKPDVAVTSASPEAARIAFGLGIPLLVFNDSPHSKAVARLVVPLAACLCSPWPVRLRDWLEAGVRPARYVKYKALDPLAWLLRRSLWPAKESWENAEGSVVVRLGETRAYYYSGGLQLDEDRLVAELSQRFRVTVLSRYYERRELSGHARVVGPGFFGPNVLEKAAAFVGFGGTMTQEAVLMGVPAVSVHPASYRIEEYLVGRGFVKKARSVEEVVRFVEAAVNPENRRSYARMTGRFLEALSDPVEVLVDAVEELVEQRL